MGRFNINSPLEAARQTTKMIGQRHALELIRQAIVTEDRGFKIVSIRAQGGMGKTRLLEEILCQTGHPDWQKSCQPPWLGVEDLAVSDLVDMINVRLHWRDRFMRAVRDGLRHTSGAAFSSYDRTYNKLQSLQAGGADPRLIRQFSNEAESAFIEDLIAESKKRRIVWIIDTVEQLRFLTSEWSIKNNLLTPQDLADRTQQWLVKLIQTLELNNITIILAGRGEEGEPFFTNIENSFLKARQTKHNLIKIHLDHFSPEETQTYFQQLAADWRVRESAFGEHVARQFEAIADNEYQRYKVLWLYTGGIPVRLALYAQLIVENRKIPEPLKWSFKKASEIAGTNDPDNETDMLRKLQWDVEDEFINMLFHHPTNPGSRILQTLVRAPRGLSALQLHFILDSQGKLLTEWTPDLTRLKDLVGLLKEMENYYLVKRRSHWIEFSSIVPDPLKEAVIYRLGLQDEIYRIYAEHVAPQADPIQEKIQAIWQTLDEATQKRYLQNREDEKKERERLYTQLREWATSEREIYRQMKLAIMQQDERELEFGLIPDQTRTFHFRQLNRADIEKRLAIQAAMETFHVEAMVYALALDPERNFNRDYIEQGTVTAKAENEDFETWGQSEMWRIMHDEYSLKFVDFQSREPVRKRDESTLDVLQRAAQQEDLTRWIKRFTLRGDYSRAVSFANQAHEIIQQLPKESEKERSVWYSWNHTLVRSERQVWSCYAQIFTGKGLPEIINELNPTVDNLIQLFESKVTEPVFTLPDGHKENGFQADELQKTPAHPAVDRLRRLISYSYNILGYGYISLGRIREAVRCYGQAIHYIRGDQGMDAHRAVVLNNLSKALSDLGRQSMAICRDGMNLRRVLVEEVPLAYSYNTLALLNDDQGRYEDAQVLAAKAIAYFRRADNLRGIGLASLQLAESLRHLAVRTEAGETVLTTAEGLYSTAEELLREALGIFEDSGELIRLIEVTIELGSLYRDRLRSLEGASALHWRAYQREADAYLDRAINEATKVGLLKLEIDARVNKVWVQFHSMQHANLVGNVEEVENIVAVINDIEKRIPSDYYITPTVMPNPSDYTMRDLHWILPQLSKLQMLRAQVALARFAKRTSHFKQLHPDNQIKRHEVIDTDPLIREALSSAAKSYSIGLGYAELFGAGSRISQILLDDLYSQLKGFNRHELKSFHDYVQLAEKEYPKLSGNALIGPFLHEFLGLPPCEDGHGGSSNKRKAQE